MFEWDIGKIIINIIYIDDELDSYISSMSKRVFIRGKRKKREGFQKNLITQTD